MRTARPHTTDWRKAREVAKEKITTIERGKVTPSSVNFAKLKFDEAADQYIESRKLELRPSSIEKEKQLLKKPKEFFGGMQLSKITADHLTQYKDWSAAQKAGPKSEKRSDPRSSIWSEG